MSLQFIKSSLQCNIESLSLVLSTCIISQRDTGFLPIDFRSCCWLWLLFLRFLYIQQSHSAAFPFCSTASPWGLIYVLIVPWRFALHNSKFCRKCHKGSLCVGNFFQRFSSSFGIKRTFLSAATIKYVSLAVCDNNNDDSVAVSQWWKSCNVRLLVLARSFTPVVMSPWLKEPLQLLLHTLAQVTQNCSDLVLILHHPPPAVPRRSSSTSGSQLLSSPACLDCWPLQAWFHHLAKNRAPTDWQIFRIYTEWHDSALYLLVGSLGGFLSFFSLL